LIRRTTAQRRRCERCIREIDRERALEYAAGSRWSDRPIVGAAILVQPRLHLGKPLPKTGRGKTDTDAHREPALGF
jgi:hypothetical protein